MKNERKEKKRKALCLILGFVTALSALILPAAAAVWKKHLKSIAF